MGSPARIAGVGSGGAVVMMAGQRSSMRLAVSSAHRGLQWVGGGATVHSPAPLLLPLPARLAGNLLMVREHTRVPFRASSGALV